VNSPRACRPCMARHGILEWKQWVLLRLAPYHWQRAGGLASANLGQYYSSARHSAPVAERSPVPPAKRRLVYETCEAATSKLDLLSTQNGTVSDPEYPRVSLPPWPRARRSPLLDSIGQIQLAMAYTWPAAAISIVKICTQTRHSGLSVHPE